MNDICDKCGRTHSGIGIFAHAFQQSEIRQGRPDPGNICGMCAATLLQQNCTTEEQAAALLVTAAACNVAIDMIEVKTPWQ